MHRWSARALALVGLTAATSVAAAAFLPVPAGAGPAEVTVTATNPLVAHSTQDVSVGEIKIIEAAVGDVPIGDVCIELTGATATWDGASDPSVSDNNTTTTTSAGDVQSPVRAKFHVDALSTGGPATFTVTGLKLDTSGTPGPVPAEVGNCTGDNNQFEATVRVAYIGAVDRLAGSDRYVTAAQISQQFACVNNSNVVIARGDNFPDALSASYLAGKLNSPILLTGPTTIPNETLAALKSLGAKEVTLIGGEAAIPAAIANYLDSYPAYPTCGGGASGDLIVTRAFGADRYSTAKSVGVKGNTLANPVAGPGTLGTVGNDTIDCAGAKKKTAIVASGENFPDALSAGPLAWAGSTAACGNESAFPLLLTQKDSLPAATSTAITDFGIEQVILVGGPAAIAPAVETAIDNLTGVSVVRVAGADRQGTAVEVTKRLLGKDAPGGLDWTGGSNHRFFVARADNFPDALVAAPLAGKETAPLFLTASTSSLGTTAENGIKAYPNPDFFHRGTLLGGDAALTPAVATQVGSAIAGQAN